MKNVWPLVMCNIALPKRLQAQYVHSTLNRCDWIRAEYLIQFSQMRNCMQFTGSLKTFFHGVRHKKCLPLLLQQR